jgi:hypothetical protein
MGLCIFIIQGKRERERERERESIDCMHERHSCRLAKELSIFPVIL